jgi:hypothetical protein
VSRRHYGYGIADLVNAHPHPNPKQIGGRPGRPRSVALAFTDTSVQSKKEKVASQPKNRYTSRIRSSAVSDPNLEGTAMPARLVALTDGPSLFLDKPILLLGRHPECDIQLNSRKISRRHCIVAQVNNYLVVRDLGSTNGIRINGVRVLEGRLKEGDELTIGNFKYQINLDGIAVDHGPAMAKPAFVAPGGDEDLEDADDPVPLADNSSGSPMIPPRTDAAPHEPLGFPDSLPDDSHVRPK